MTQKYKTRRTAAKFVPKIINCPRTAPQFDAVAYAAALEMLG